MRYQVLNSFYTAFIVLYVAYAVHWVYSTAAALLLWLMLLAPACYQYHPRVIRGPPRSESLAWLRIPYVFEKRYAEWCHGADTWSQGPRWCPCGRSSVPTPASTSSWC
jgi:hypothetical protein